MASEQVILEQLAMLTEYYDKEPSERQARIYLATLKDIDDQILEAAVLDHIAKSTWFPKVNELRQTAHAVITNNNRTTQYRMEHATDQDLYWSGMAAYNVRLVGKITDDQLEADRGWRFCVARGVVDLTPDIEVSDD